MSATAESLIDELAYAGRLLHAGEPDTNGDLDGSPDIAATGFGPRQRYPTHGEIDSRAQAINDAGTQSLREPELPRVLSCGRSADKQACSQFVHDLPDDVASGFEVPGSPPAVAYPSLQQTADSLGRLPERG